MVTAVPVVPVIEPAPVWAAELSTDPAGVHVSAVQTTVLKALLVPQLAVNVVPLA